MTEVAPLATAPVGDPPRCPSCLAVQEPGQRYCLECGASLGPPAPTGPRLPGGLGAPALGLAVLFVLAAALGLAWAVGRDDEDAGEQLVATAPSTVGGLAPGETAATPTAPLGSGTVTAATGPDGATATTDAATTEGATTDGATTGEGTTGTTTTDDEDEDGTTGDDPTAEDDDWPSGRDGWAAVLISEERDEVTRAAMEDLQEQAEDRGLSDLGILVSDAYDSLNPGYRVLYQGPFDTRAEARRAALAAKRNGYPNAYPRRVAS